MAIDGRQLSTVWLKMENSEFLPMISMHHVMSPASKE